MAITEKPCNSGCGKMVHFNRQNPQGFQQDGTPKGKWFPLEYLQTAQGMFEQLHACPNRQQQAAPQQAIPQYNNVPQHPGLPQAVPVAQQATPAQRASGPSITEQLLEQTKALVLMTEKVLAVNAEQLSILKALHPEFATKPVPVPVQEGPQTELAPANEELGTE